MDVRRGSRGVGLIVIWSAIAGSIVCGVKAHAGESVPTEATFYIWVFGRDLFQTAVTPDVVRRRMIANLKYKLIWIDVKCGLSEEQQSKLRLAGEIQVTHFLDQIDEQRQVFLGVKDDPERLKKFLLEIRLLQEAWTLDPFSEQSFFWKTLRRTLSQAQVAKAETFFHELEENEWRELLREFVKVEGDTLGLNETQRARLLALLTKQTSPTHKLASFRWRALLTEVSRIPEEAPDVNSRGETMAETEA